MYLDTSKIDRNSLSDHDRKQLYNALDCCLTYEIWEKQRAELANRPLCEATYRFEMAYWPALIEMSLRGWRVDLVARDNALRNLETIHAKLQYNLNRLAEAVWAKPLNANSTQQKEAFFYDTMGLPPSYKTDGGERRRTVDRDALEKLEPYFYARPFVLHIQKLREIGRLASTLRSGVDEDSRLRANFNPGTVTGRLSSSRNVYGTGTNLQNITPELRRIFISDPGHRLISLDLEQAESRAVGAIIFSLFGDRTYLDACESGDLHTYVAKLCWPHLKTREDAEQPFYRHFSYRDMAKRLGHGSNYGGTPWTMSKHTKIPLHIVQEFQERYFLAFPHIRKWHNWVAEQVMTKQVLVTALGRERLFFGRSDDDATIREAIAHEPQSLVAEVTNLGVYKVWRKCPWAQLLAQVHDAIIYQQEESADEAQLIKAAQSEIEISIPFESRCGGKTLDLVIPSAVKTGWNWQEVGNDFIPVHDKKAKPNPDGLMKYKGQDARRRHFPVQSGLVGLIP